MDGLQILEGEVVPGKHSGGNIIYIKMLKTYKEYLMENQPLFFGERNKYFTSSHVKRDNLGLIWSGEYRIRDLSAAVLYTARVSGNNEHGPGPASDPFIFGTAGARLPEQEKLVSNSSTVTLYNLLLVFALIMSCSYP